MRDDLQATIEYFKAYSKEYEPVSNNVPKYIVDDLNEQAQLYRTALSALRDALRRQDGCDVCNHDGFDEMVCYIPTENGDGLMVMSNYCPNCGCEISKQAIKYGAGYVDQDILRSAT